jgi:hypothetical protein
MTPAKFTNDFERTSRDLRSRESFWVLQGGFRVLQGRFWVLQGRAAWKAKQGLNAVARFAEITPRTESAISGDRHRRGKAWVSLARHARGIENS